MTAPALRLAVPLAVGIVASSAGIPLPAAIGVVAFGVVLYAAMTLLSRTPTRRYAMRSWWSIPLSLVAFGLGITTAILHQPPRLNLAHVNGRTALLSVDDVTRRDFSMTLHTSLLTIEGDTVPTGHRLLITTRGCDYTLMPGMTVGLRLNLSPITNMGNPDEYDYAGLMLRRGFRYRQHVTFNEMRVVTIKGHDIPWRTRLTRWRWQLEQQVLQTPVSATTQQLVIAMLLGDSRLIDADIRQTFTRAGVAHILALSGLHMVLVTWLAWLLLLPLDLLLLRRVRLLLTIVLMADYAVFTGLSPSVLRASIMIAMAIASELLYRRSSPVNALGVAALCILVVDPSQLQGAGFQLSFITMAALLVALPRGEATQSGIWAIRLKSAIMATVVAIVATLLVSVHHFNTISVVSIVANVLISPLVPVVMGLASVFALLSAAGLEFAPVSQATDAVCRLMEWIATQTASLPGGHFDGLYASEATAILYVVAVALLCWWLHSRGRAMLIATAVVTLAMVVSMVLTRLNTPSKGVIVINDYTHTPIFSYNGSEGLLWIPDDGDSTAVLRDKFINAHRAMLARRGIRQLTCVNGKDTLSRDDMTIRPPYASLQGFRMVALQHREWMREGALLPIHTDVAVLTKSFRGSIQLLNRYYSPSCVISSRALPTDSAKLLNCPHIVMEQTGGVVLSDINKKTRIYLHASTK